MATNPMAATPRIDQALEVLRQLSPKTESGTWSYAYYLRATIEDAQSGVAWKTDAAEQAAVVLVDETLEAKNRTGEQWLDKNGDGVYADDEIQDAWHDVHAAESLTELVDGDGVTLTARALEPGSTSGVALAQWNGLADPRRTVHVDIDPNSDGRVTSAERVNVRQQMLRKMRPDHHNYLQRTNVDPELTDALSMVYHWAADNDPPSRLVQDAARLLGIPYANPTIGQIKLFMADRRAAYRLTSRVWTKVGDIEITGADILHQIPTRIPFGRGITGRPDVIARKTVEKTVGVSIDPMDRATYRDVRQQVETVMALAELAGWLQRKSSPADSRGEGSFSYFRRLR